MLEHFTPFSAYWPFLSVSFYFILNSLLLFSLLHFTLEFVFSSSNFLPFYLLQLWFKIMLLEPCVYLGWLLTARRTPLGTLWISKNRYTAAHD